MGIKRKICVVFLLFVAVFLVSATASFSRAERDPETGGQGKERNGGGDDDGRYATAGFSRAERDPETGVQGKERNGGGNDDGRYNIILAEEESELQKIVEDCHQGCQGSEGEQQHPECFRTCMEKRFQQPPKPDTRQTEKGKKGDPHFTKQQQSNNPYVFKDRHFTTRLETDLGSVKALQKFTDRSDLFKGIEKYRVVFLEAEPQTFIIPNHWDAHALFFVANGDATINLINTDSRHSYNIKRGDMFRVPAEITAYLINRSNNQKLVLIKILRSVSVPGELQTFFSVGGENPESSFLNAFSTEVLEAAFDVDRDSVDRLFSQPKREQGIFKKATEEQIKSLTGKDGISIWPFGDKTGPYNFYKKNPSVQNDYGNLHEVDSDDFSDLRDIDVAFSFFNISQGSMAGPFYNTKATRVLVVSNGEGRFEMACPHLSEQASSTRGTGPRYEKVTSEIRQGTVVVIPAGHPLVIEASGNQNIEVVSFGLNSDKNEWFPLAGRGNVMSQWENEAIELTFGLPVKEVQNVIQKQNKRLFFKGPARRGRALA